MKAKSPAYPYIAWMALFILVPLGVVAYFAFTTTKGQFTLDNLMSIGAYLPVLMNSAILALISAAACLLIGYPVAYTISKCKPATQTILTMLIMIPMCMSFLLRTLAWVSLLEDTGIINNILGALGIKPFKMINTPGAVVLGMVYNFLPYMIVPLYNVLMKIDYKVVEAAQDLGASHFDVFRKVILPLSFPGIISGITMVFVPAVSTFYISDKLGGASTQMVGDVIEKQFKQAYNTNVGAALSLLLMVLVFACMFIVNRFSDADADTVII